MNIPQLLQLLAMGQNVSAQLPCFQGSSKENTDSCKKKKDLPFTEEENQVLIHLYRDNYLEAQKKGSNLILIVGKQLRLLSMRK